ncbi:MAG TPA: molybdopterin cofactor-binding domain-containing protein, partial [Anaerolineales bacterium]
LDVATDMLDVLGPAELAAGGGQIYVKDRPERNVTVAAVAKEANLGKGCPPIGNASYNPKTTFLDPETGHGTPYEAYVFATQIAEVEVDTETGEVRVLRIAAAHDCGKAINPMMVEGQIEGGISMGLGYGLLEEIVQENGVVKNPQFTDYILPTALDMPPDIRVAIVEEPVDTGPFGAKGVGEPSLIPTAPAIINAIYDAVGVRIRDLPATPSKILAALEEKSST